MMKTISTLMMLLCICFLGSCTQKTELTSTTKTVTVHKPKVIHVYFFDGFNKNLGEYTIKELHKTFDKVVFEGTIPFPDSAYYAPRNRYKADKLVKHLRHCSQHPRNWS